MPAYSDPKFIAGAVGLVFGGARVLGARKPSEMYFPDGNGGTRIFDTVAVQRAATAGLSASSNLSAQTRDPNAVVTVAMTADDPRAIARRFEPGYIDIIRQSLAANAPLSGGNAEQIAGSGVDLAADMNPLAVLDRINALDETWGAALESYRRTFAAPTRAVSVRAVYFKSSAFNWTKLGSYETKTTQQIQDTAALGPVIWLDGVNNPTSEANAARVEITDSEQRAFEYYPARLAAIRATTEALIFGRNPLSPWMAAILDDTTGNLTEGWMSYLATFQVSRDDIAAMAQQIAQQMQPKPSAWDSFLRTMSGAVSFMLGGVNLVSSVGNYAQNIGSAAAVDWIAAANEAANITNQALQVYGAGVRLTSTQSTAPGQTDVVGAPMSPEEGRILGWLNNRPFVAPAELPCFSRPRGSSVPTKDTVRGAYLRGLAGGGVPVKAFLSMFSGGVDAFEDAIQASGVLGASAALLTTPGAATLKCTLLARRWPIVIGSSFAQVFVPFRGPLPYVGG